MGGCSIVCLVQYYHIISNLDISDYSTLDIRTGSSEGCMYYFIEIGFQTYTFNLQAFNARKAK